MKIQEVIDFLEGWAPLQFQEPYDNSGLLVGDSNLEITGVLVCLDSIEKIIDEAIQRNCNMVIAHHPILFGGLKSITGKTYIERTIIKAIKNDIVIYAIHTNLDNIKTGVNQEIANRIGLVNQNILLNKKNMLSKVTVYVPIKHADEVRTAMFDAGAGHISKYDQCSFNTEGIGTFRALVGTNPYIGEVGTQQKEPEVGIEVVVRNAGIRKLLNAVNLVHPYEEVAYDLVALDNESPEVGSGIIGELKTPEQVLSFLKKIKTVFNSGVIKYTAANKNKRVKKVAVCGGAGSFLLSAAIAQNADIFITADYKYHQFFDADSKIIIADIGHFESEQYTTELIVQKLKEKFSTFAVHFTEVSTNPVNYL
ncbi:MAG: Nif3-like dinuclear metal center hexameric protein [Crocinitomicaceae bacterium]|nr:Nif3-like dinuclear metal center hexameric protein [Crocinitomicaceae bacterium]MBT6513390.1 Nif3-like dinuclear metal center hexameric protein [Crocinitomicaceae bacterium]